jgi:hypothetical protein
MNATAEMQRRSPSGDQPILAITGSFVSYRISLVANLFAGKLAGFVRRRSSRPQRRERREVTAVVGVEIRLSAHRRALPPAAL